MWNCGPSRICVSVADPHSYRTRWPLWIHLYIMRAWRFDQYLLDGHRNPALVITTLRIWSIVKYPEKYLLYISIMLPHKMAWDVDSSSIFWIGDSYEKSYMGIKLSRHAKSRKGVTQILWSHFSWWFNIQIRRMLGVKGQTSQSEMYYFLEIEVPLQRWVLSISIPSFLPSWLC